MSPGRTGRSGAKKSSKPALSPSRVAVKSASDAGTAAAAAADGDDDDSEGSGYA